MSDTTARPDTIRVLIADDHQLFRQGLRMLLDAEGFDVVGEAADGEQAVVETTRLRPDLLLLDNQMPRLSGLEALARLQERNLPTKVVMLTAGLDRREVVEGLRLGVRGVLLKDATPALMFRCMRDVMKGGYWVEHGAVGDLIEAMCGSPRGREADRPATLTPRELQIVAAVVDGASNGDIGQQFGMRPQTVKNHLTAIFDKLGVSNRLELALYAVNNSLIPVEAVARLTS